MRPALILILLAAAAICATAVVVPVSTKAPGGLSKPPQFILLSHDDAVNSEAHRLVFDVSNSYTNPNGCKIPVTWFGCTKGWDFSCSWAKKIWQAGHEMASHTVNHPRNLRSLSYSNVAREIVGARDRIVSCGIPASQVTGFRTPFLSDSPTVRRVLADNGFRYDSTIGVKGGRNKLWPATMEKGVPYDCSQAGQQCSSSERYPGMWQVPLYEDSDGNLMDYCTNEATSKPRSGCSVHSRLRKMFSDAYDGNRAPVTVGFHSVTTGWLREQQVPFRPQALSGHRHRPARCVGAHTHPAARLDGKPGAQR